MSTPGPGAYTSNPNQNITKLRKLKNDQYLNYSRTSELKHRSRIGTESSYYYTEAYSSRKNAFRNKKIIKRTFKSTPSPSPPLPTPSPSIAKNNPSNPTYSEIKLKRSNLKKPKSMAMIRKNNESIKFTLTDPKLRNPSIPCILAVTHRQAKTERSP